MTERKPSVTKTRFILRIILGIIFLVPYYLYFSCPIFDFAEPKPFSGQVLHNPYQSIGSAHWLKYNFQVQSRAWGGLTDGRRNSNHLIDSIYRFLGYNYVATSDYQRINDYEQGTLAFIPTYEHGFNIPKVHQVCIGAKEVLWRDYVLFQTLNHKQHVLNELRNRTDLIALAHPRLLDGYTLADMKYLQGYDLMEVLNNLRLSEEHWDEALSNGHLSYILANDDAHDVLNPNEVGRRFTLIHSGSLSSDSILHALGSGMAYGVDFYRIDDEPLQDKILRYPNLPQLVSQKVFGDTLQVMLDKPVHKIQFYGDKGSLLNEVLFVEKASYVIQDSNSYVRVVAQCYDASRLLLNPVTRQQGEGQHKLVRAKVNLVKTTALRLAGLLLLVLFFVHWFKSRAS